MSARRAGRQAGPQLETVVGLLARQRRAVVVQPLFESGQALAVDSVGSARPGQIVIAQTGRRARGNGRVLKALGRPENARAVIEAYMVDRGLERRFPPGIARAAEDAIARVARADPATAGARRDLRKQATFTIDPWAASDFDDAISAEPAAQGRVRVWVHIADVSAYVRPGTAVDREAFRRGTSVYVPGIAEPMLPESLSSGVCSLLPGEDRLAVSVELEFDGAQVVKSSLYRSLIRSDHRFTYADVDALFTAGKGSTRAAPAAVMAALAAAREVAKALRKRRQQSGALELQSGEPEFDFDSDGNVAALRVATTTEAHELVEHLMIAAGEVVAQLLAARKLPTLFRVHERPDPAAAERLIAQLASLEVPTPPLPASSAISPRQAGELIAACSRQVADEIRRRDDGGGRGLTALILRSLKQARYDPQNLGHAGLNLHGYCHFTSPIRRYPDLICHRAVLAAIGAGEEAPRGDGTLATAATWTSAREREAIAIERGADDIARAFLLEREMLAAGLPPQLTGEVVGLVGGGAFIAFAGGFEGFLPARKLGGDWFELSEEGTVLRGAGSGRRLRIGQLLEVSVRKIEPIRGRVELDLAADGGT